jgi:F420-0:gamma-glutamyl ligase
VSGSLRADRPQSAPGMVAIPVRTRLVSPGDDLVRLIEESVAGIASAGDVIAVSETAVAIAQRQAVAAEFVRPSSLALFLSRHADPMATVSQPESLQIVIDNVGYGRVVYAAVMQVLGRLGGRRGMFYEILGGAIAAIDGYTGTMPPFERTIVFAPQNPDAFAQSVFERLGIACAVVDANDLHKAQVLGLSSNVNRDAVSEALVSNPHGNGDEQTPIVVLKWRGGGDNPLVAVP